MATTTTWLGTSHNALGVVRVSSKKQGDNNSPGVQRDGIKAYAAVHRLKLTDVVMIEESAKKSDNRIEFHGALARAKKEKIRHIVFWVWDRTTRNFTDYELLEDLIRDDDLVLHVANDHWQLHAGSDEGDWLKAEMNTLVAKTYSRQLSRRAKEAQDAKARDGWYPTRPPLGYRNQKLVGTNGVVKDRGGTIALTDAGRTLLRRMFELRLANFSLEAIGEAVSKEGLWTAAGRKDKRVLRGNVEAILKHEFYVGWFTWRGQRYRGKHETVFTMVEWERLQATFGGGTSRGTPLERVGALQGLLTCAECGCAITYDPKTKPSGRRYDYYRCADGKRVHSKRIHVTEENVLSQFERAIVDIALPEELADEIARVLRETHDVVRRERRREVAKLKQALDDVQAKEDKGLALFVDGKLDEAAYQRQRQLVQAERQALVDKLADASEELDDRYLMVADRIFELAKRASSLWKMQTPAERRRTLELVVSNPTLDSATVRYDMKKPFAVLSEMKAEKDWRARRDSNREQGAVR